MSKFVTLILAALIACAAAKPGIVAPLAAAAYANAPLYAAGSSSQIDVRNNYDGTLSSYTTAPFNYAGPFASRYVSGVPAAFASAAAPLAAAPLAAAPFAAPYSAPYATPYSAPYTAPYAAPFAAPFAAPTPFVL